ncbi:hypothetical protein [Spiroplasma endosymbiont of Lonchoptera lutea]|uniref:hypothetical protein n=1 Tax=Spiroplasma endosymbiont of Lonchoptera lutea TaxID=3066297 RepID=UPI0030D05C37
MKKLLRLLSVLTVSGTAMPTVIATSPYQKEENNLQNLEDLNRVKRQSIEKWYKFLAHDELKIKFSNENIKEIIFLFESKKEEEFIKELVKMMKKFYKEDHSGAGGYIFDSDYEIVATTIWKNFSYFHEIYLGLKNNEGIVIKTNTVGYWDNDNPNNSIYKY